VELPDALRQAIETETAGLGATALERASAELTGGYRAAAAPARLTPAQRLAYVAVRLPATFAAAHAALAELRARRPRARVERLLDLGAGPGTVAWAAACVFDELREVTCVERDTALAALGRRLAADAPNAALRDARWIEADLGRGDDLPGPHDLVVASYVLGELPASGAERLVDAARAAGAALLLIEPGTPGGFERILRARTALVASGARVLAPCPHAAACPLEGRDFCHFAARVARSSEHRRAKGGALNYEDEKFAYLAMACDGQGDAAPARIVRRPLPRGGHVILDLCATDGLRREVVGRRAGDAYRRARDAGWGDAWE
jgi:ribosomal protein RSM22 (predicted rRNA methylase)